MTKKYLYQGKCGNKTITRTRNTKPEVEAFLGNCDKESIFALTKVGKSIRRTKLR